MCFSSFRMRGCCSTHPSVTNKGRTNMINNTPLEKNYCSSRRSDFYNRSKIGKALSVTPRILVSNAEQEESL